MAKCSINEQFTGKTNDDSLPAAWRRAERLGRLNAELKYRLVQGFLMQAFLDCRVAALLAMTN
jgi:hypothetical protein